MTSFKLYTIDNEFVGEVDTVLPKGFTGIIKDKFGSIHWKVDGKYHSLKGPAIKWDNGSEEWYVNGKRHRIDGPATKLINGYKAWYINGDLISCNTNEEFKLLVDMMKLKGLL